MIHSSSNLNNFNPVYKWLNYFILLLWNTTTVHVDESIKDKWVRLKGANKQMVYFERWRQNWKFAV